MSQFDLVKLKIIVNLTNNMKSVSLFHLILLLKVLYLPVVEPSLNQKDPRETPDCDILDSRQVLCTGIHTLLKSLTRDTLPGETLDLHVAVMSRIHVF